MLPNRSHDFPRLLKIGFRVDLGRLDVRMAEDHPGRLDAEFSTQKRPRAVPQLIRVPAICPAPLRGLATLTLPFAGGSSKVLVPQGSQASWNG